VHGERTVECEDTNNGSRILSLLVLQSVCCAEEHSRIKTTHFETQHNVGTNFLFIVTGFQKWGPTYLTVGFVL
jgi:hypothetical protein